MSHVSVIPHVAATLPDWRRQIPIPLILAVDFDGTIVKAAYPNIGAVVPGAIHALTAIRGWGGRVVLWTCRRGESLEAAVEWAAKRGLVFDAVNADLPELIEFWGAESRKVYADVYVDDRALVPGGDVLGEPDWEQVLGLAHSWMLRYGELKEELINAKGGD